jgi:hypothetical protein
MYASLREYSTGWPAVVSRNNDSIKQTISLCVQAQVLSNALSNARNRVKTMVYKAEGRKEKATMHMYTCTLQSKLL